MRIGFIGLGAMGRPMARRLLDAGHELYVSARRESSAEALVAGGARWLSRPAEIARATEMVFTCLPMPADVEAVVNGEDGLAGAFRPGSLYVDLSTNSPAIVRRLAGELAARDVAMLDAPVSGGPGGAASGRLAIWASGDAGAFDACRTVLDHMGDKVSYLGPAGHATIAKLVHNCANFGINAVLAEVFAMGVKAGVDPALLFSAIRNGSIGRQSPVDRLAEQFLPARFDPPAFALSTAHKDVALAAALAGEENVPMPIASLVLATMTEALNRGWHNRDVRSAMAIATERAGVAIEVPSERLAEILR